MNISLTISVPKLTRLAILGVGIPTCAATARFFPSILQSRAAVMESYWSKLMFAAAGAEAMERNPTLRTAWCSAAGKAAKVCPRRKMQLNISSTWKNFPVPRTRMNYRYPHTLRLAHGDQAPRRHRAMQQLRYPLHTWSDMRQKLIRRGLGQRVKKCGTMVAHQQKLVCDCTRTKPCIFVQIVS